MHSKIMIQMRYNNIQSNAIIYNFNLSIQSEDMRSLLEQSSSQNIKIEDNETDPFIQASNLNKVEVNRSRTWSRSQLYLIGAFLYYNSDKFSSESSKKQFKIYKYMSLFIQSRNINQCRSYTNKLLKSFGNINSINSYFKQSLPLYDHMVQKLKIRNEQTFAKTPLIYNYDSNDRIQHTTTDKIIVNTIQPTNDCTSSTQENQRICGVLIPQPQKWRLAPDHSIFRFNLLYQQANLTLCDFMHQKSFQWAQGSSFLPVMRNQFN